MTRYKARERVFVSWWHISSLKQLERLYEVVKGVKMAYFEFYSVHVHHVVPLYRVKKCFILNFREKYQGGADFMKIDWKRKLTSRKLWTSIASFVSMLLIFFGHAEGEATKIAALIMAGASIIGYVIGEGLADSGNGEGKDETK